SMDAPQFRQQGVAMDLALADVTVGDVQVQVAQHVAYTNAARAGRVVVEAQAFYFARKGPELMLAALDGARSSASGDEIGNNPGNTTEQEVHAVTAAGRGCKKGRHYAPPAAPCRLPLADPSDLPI